MNTDMTACNASSTDRGSVTRSGLRPRNAGKQPQALAPSKVAAGRRPAVRMTRREDRSDETATTEGLEWSRLSSRRIVTLLILTVVLVAAHSHAAPTNSVSLNLENALRMAEKHSPALQGAIATQIAAEQRARAAGLPQNPRVVLGTEGFRGGSSGEVIAGVSQTIPIGRERRLDREAAQAGRDRAALQVDAARLKLEQRVRGAFATALFAQKNEDLFSERIVILKNQLRLAKARAGAGDATVELGELAHAALDHELLERDEAASLRRKAFAALATGIGRPDMRVGAVTGELETNLALETIRSIAAELENLPAARAADQAAIVAELRARQTRASRIPSLNLNLLHRRDLAARQSGADVNVGISLPLFDNKQAAARAFEAEAEASRQYASRLRQQSQLTYGRLIADLETALRRNDHIRNEILPHHKRIVARRRALFEAGESSRDEYEAARLGLTKERRHHLETLREIHRIWAQLAALEKTP